jgi:3-dehydroquinate synthase
VTESFPPGRVVVGASGAPYTVVVGPGIVGGLPEELARTLPGRRVALISDSHVAPLHAERIADSCRAADIDVALLTFEAGEASKTRKTWSILTDQMLEAGLGRDSCVVAVGGGVTTDLAGFVAATYMRGVPTVLVPTSYLAMVDASVGGKTGVDVRAGKNLVGAFHAPELVLADTELLATLPHSERGQGLVEAYKHGAILDEEHFQRLKEGRSELLSADPVVAARAILESVALKAAVVARDEFEGGYRQILNFGHTLGHTIEAASEYEVGHGAAVALGMLGEAVLGERLGVTSPGTSETLEAALRPLIGTSGLSIDVDRALRYLSVDKKARSGDARFVLLERVGHVSPGDGWTHAVPRSLVEEVLSEVMG